jgi:hypothetical protein
MTIKPSILTSLSGEKSAANLKTMGRESILWLTKKIAELRNPIRLALPITKEKSRYTRPADRQKFLIGALYFFVYDPKGKNDLPYYDRFPLVMPLQRYDDGFLGLNLHYLPLKYRVAFMRKLMALAIMNDDDEIKRIRITYDILEASKRFKEFRPCIKRYLYPHVKSRILAVLPEEWDIAIHIPVQQFKGATPNQVWKESVEEIRNS